MKTVILCGGSGLRFREFTEETPKALIEIGSKPILWHVMKKYAYHGFNDFVLVVDYLGDKIKEYFAEKETWKNKDFSLKLKTGELQTLEDGTEDWNITFLSVSTKYNTGGSIKKIEKVLKKDADDDFAVTYCDGLADLDVIALKAFHNKHGKTATITTARPATHYGIVESDPTGRVTSFKEKPKLDWWVNGGFMFFKKQVLDVLQEYDVLERRPFEELAQRGEIYSYKHDGFWVCMDTYKDWTTLNELWNAGKAPWKVW